MRHPMPDGSCVELIFNYYRNEFLFTVIGKHNRTIYTQWLTRDQGQALIDSFAAMSTV